MKISLYLNQTLITTLSDDKVEEIFTEYVEDNYPEMQPTEKATPHPGLAKSLSAVVDSCEDPVTSECQQEERGCPGT